MLTTLATYSAPTCLARSEVSDRKRRELPFSDSIRQPPSSRQRKVRSAKMHKAQSALP
ncbi:hypothetical protein [Rhodococcus jostii]|uniref:hypothetical protein n=1 Tax=Rhodococcus jostii TaxID=132919 RepID=UPI000AD5614B|nr:hypothetical protein [Rhodococcus jostii]